MGDCDVGEKYGVPTPLNRAMRALMKGLSIRGQTKAVERDSLLAFRSSPEWRYHNRD